MNTQFLVADIGGTHARFALSMPDGVLSEIDCLRTADFPTIEEAIRAYLSAHRASVDHAVIAIATPITSDRVAMTNHHWAFSIRALQDSLGLQRLLVINDFSAQALAVLSLQDHQYCTICPGIIDHTAPKAVLGPGTGLGVSGLIRGDGGRWCALAGEGGHVSFAPQTEDEWRVYQYARRHYPEHVSAERLLSGNGLSLIDAALADAGEAHTRRRAEEIGAAAFAGELQARHVWDVFHGMLASVAADLALTLGARGGVYLCGGILPRSVDLLTNGVFAERFVAKGRCRDYLADIPVYLLLHDDCAGLYGAATALSEECRHA
ncbi:glucokinase [Suttonella sp. R2A3]|uniref:glucokinase n=1 Tax=Suttonella sp. R2A3 TaxID=2908648 RepID=UPI0038FC8E2E